MTSLLLRSSVSLQRPGRAFLCPQPFNLQMQKVQNNDVNYIKLNVADDLSVTVLQDATNEWLMSVNDVATGYGVSIQTVHSHLSNHSDEFREGTHYLPAYEIFVTSQTRRVKMLTKAGVTRLGFFIKSERAKMFRDWAEQVILEYVAPTVTAPKLELPQTTRRNHNRLSKDRLVEILGLVALVDDKEVRTALVKKLMPSLDIPSVQLQLPFEVKGGSK